MKKSILIGLGILILLLGIGIWVYLLVYGAPKNAGEVFGNFSLGGNAGERTGEEYDDPSTEDTGVENVTNPALRQLTTRPVAGAIFLGNDAIRYVERGTGHVYEIALPYGEETLVSNTTIPQTVEAHFSQNGEHVILSAERGEKNETMVASLETGAENEMGGGISLPPNSSNARWDITGNDVLYLLEDEKGSRGIEYNFVSGTSTELFQIPLRDVVVLWGKITYIYTTPSAQQTGYVYRMHDGLEYVTTGARGLMAIPFNGGIALTGSNAEGKLNSFLPNDLGGLSLPLIPEKCTSLENGNSTLYCATPVGYPAGQYPDDWYKGEISFSDFLWKVDINAKENLLLSNFLSESGREIDVAQIGTNPDGIYIYFINKNDGTLWMYDTTVE